MYTKTRRQVENSVGETDNKHTHTPNNVIYVYSKISFDCQSVFSLPAVELFFIKSFIQLVYWLFGPNNPEKHFKI